MARPQRWLDLCGIGFSLGCGVHCVALAVVLTTLPGVWLSGELLGLPLAWWRVAELAMSALAILTASVSLALGWRRHRKRWPSALGLLGAGMLTWGLFAPVSRAWLVGIAFVVIGGGLLAGAHVANRWLWRRVDGPG